MQPTARCWYDVTMDGFGPITNTPTLEGAVISALKKLEGRPQSPALMRLQEQGIQYRDILASWELMPPQPVEQSDTVSKVLQLLGEIMRYVNDPKHVVTASPLVSSPPSASMPPPSGPSPFASSRSPSGARHSAAPRRSAHTNKRLASVGRIELDMVLAGKHARADVIFPFRRPWRTLPELPGGVVRQLHDDSLTGEQHLILRLVEGAELPDHRQDNAEVIYILSGGLRVGDESVFAGTVIRTQAGNVCPVLTSLGETELLIMGTYRDELNIEPVVSTAL
jgi:hypothetical protein